MIERDDDAALAPESFDDGLAQAFEVIAETLLTDPLADPDSLLQDYPQYAEKLRSMLPAMKILADAGSQDAPSNSHPPGHAPFIPMSDQTIRTLGDYQILDEIGRGGMGVVYAAQQISLARHVALKVLPMAALLDPRQLTRFHNEARTAATLNHPHIVPVYAVGEERGVHYYAMQYIRGHSMAEVIAAMRSLVIADARNEAESVPSVANSVQRSATGIGDQDPSNRKSASVGNGSEFSLLKSEVTTQVAALSTVRSGRPGCNYWSLARLGVQVARALDYAHSVGVLHRDIKPANILIDMEGQAWIADFGLARLEGDAGMTMTGDLVGTLRYMSPEQALAKRVVIDHRSDVYSLGVTLYELLTLEPAIVGTDREELLRMIAFDDPRLPRKIDAALPADLETIVMKATAKRPDDRYASAGELADDLERFVNRQPIHATPPTLVDRIVKWSSRHQAAAWATVCVLTIVTLASILGLVWFARVNRQLTDATTSAAAATAETERALAQETNSKIAAEIAKRSAQQSDYFATMRQTHADWKDGQTMRLFESLMRFVPAEGEEDFRQWEWYYLLGLCRQGSGTLRGHAWGINGVAWSPQGDRLATACADRTVRIWNVETKQTVNILGHSDTVRSVAWHPDGKRVVTGSFRDKIHVWNIESGEIVQEFSIDEGQSSFVEFSSDGRFLAAAIAGWGFKVWDVANADQVWSWKEADHPESGSAWELAWSADSRRLACGTNGGGSSIHIWDVIANQESLVIAEPVDLAGLAWSGQHIANSNLGGEVDVFDSTTGKRLQSFSTGASVGSVTFNHDQSLLVATGDQQVIVWELASGRKLGSFRGHVGRLSSLASHPTHNFIASVGFDATARIWNLDNVATAGYPPREKSKYAGDLVRSPDERLLADADLEHQCVRVLRADDFTELLSFELPIDYKCDLAWDSRSKTLAMASLKGSVILLDVVTGQVTRTLKSEFDGNVESVIWSPDGHRIAASIAATGNRENVRVVCWEVRSRKQVYTFNPFQRRSVDLAWSPDGAKLASTGSDGTIKIWNAHEGELMHTLVGDSSSVWTEHLAWSPDSRTLATGMDRYATIWDAETGELLRKLFGHTSWLVGIAWSPDGKRLVTHSSDQTVRLWDPRAGIEILVFEGNRLGGQGVSFRDNDRLVYGQQNLQIWDARLGRDYALTRHLWEDQAHLLISRGELSRAFEVCQLLDADSASHSRVSYRLFINYSRKTALTLRFSRSFGGTISRALTTWQSFVDKHTPEQDKVIGVSPVYIASIELLESSSRALTFLSWAAYDSPTDVASLHAVADAVERFLEQASLPQENRLELFERVARLRMGLGFGPPTSNHLDDPRQTFSRGVAMLQDVLAHRPADTSLLSWISTGQTRCLDWQNCDLDNAYACARRLLDLKPGPNSWQVYGWACFRVGKLDEAHEWLAKFNDLNQWPADLESETRDACVILRPTGLFGLALVDHARGNLAEAREYYNEAVSILNAHKGYHFYKRLSPCAPVFHEAAKLFDDLETTEQIKYRSWD